MGLKGYGSSPGTSALGTTIRSSYRSAVAGEGTGVFTVVSVAAVSPQNLDIVAVYVDRQHGRDFLSSGHRPSGVENVAVPAAGPYAVPSALLLMPDSSQAGSLAMNDGCRPSALTPDAAKIAAHRSAVPGKRAGVHAGIPVAAVLPQDINEIAKHMDRQHGRDGLSPRHGPGSIERIAVPPSAPYASPRTFLLVPFDSQFLLTYCRIGGFGRITAGIIHDAVSIRVVTMGRITGRTVMVWIHSYSPLLYRFSNII